MNIKEVEGIRARPRTLDEARDVLLRATEANGLELRELSQWHFQIVGGGVVVNYWPTSKKRSAHVKGETRSVGPMNVYDVIRLVLCKQERKVYGPAPKRANQRQIKLVLLSRDPHCWYCRTRLTVDTATVDHKVPLSRGGSNRRANKVLACQGCNKDKADATMEDLA